MFENQKLNEFVKFVVTRSVSPEVHNVTVVSVQVYTCTCTSIVVYRSRVKKQHAGTTRNVLGPPYMKNMTTAFIFASLPIP